MTWNCWVKEVLIPKISDARCRAHFSEAGSHWHCLCWPRGCPLSAPRSPSGGSETLGSEGPLASPHSAAFPGGPSNRGAGGQADGERPRVDEPLLAALLGWPGPAEQHGRLQSSAASSSRRTTSISREGCFPTASRLIHVISIFPYNVYFVLEHTGSATSAGHRCTATCAISYLSDSACLPSGQCPGWNCIPPGLVSLAGLYLETGLTRS